MSDSSSLTYVEMPDGIFTSDGIWYHTSMKDLMEFAPGILSRLGPAAIFQKAGDWSRLPTTCALWVLPCLLLVSEPWQAITGSLLIFVLLQTISPSVVFYSIIPILRGLNHPIVQGLFYVLAMSYFASSGQKIEMGIGLGGFILFRWQIVSRLLAPLVSRLQESLSILPPNDQILRNILIRASQKYGEHLDEVDRMEKRIIEIMTYRKRKK